jgi:hypothetical protein
MVGISGFLLLGERVVAWLWWLWFFVLLLLLFLLLSLATASSIPLPSAMVVVVMMGGDFPSSGDGAIGQQRCWVIHRVVNRHCDDGVMCGVERRSILLCVVCHPIIFILIGFS